MKKICKTCKEPKELNEFYKDESKLDKRKDECRQCCTKKAIERYNEKKASDRIF